MSWVSVAKPDDKRKSKEDKMHVKRHMGLLSGYRARWCRAMLSTFKCGP